MAFNSFCANFRRHLSSVLFLEKLSGGNKLKCKVERLNDEPSHLDLRCLQNLIKIASGSEKVKAG